MENLSVYGWESDVLKITKSDYAYEFEIKISRGDFKNDFKHKKKKHLILESREGNIPNYFYYVVPELLIQEEEIPEYAGLIYVHATIIGNNTPYYSFREIKKAPKLHDNKIDINELNLVDKFYYNYIHWKHKHEDDLNDYKKLLIETKTFDNVVYKYSLPEAMNVIQEYENKIKNLELELSSLQDDYFYEVGLNRRFKKTLKENNIDVEEIIKKYER